MKLTHALCISLLVNIVAAFCGYAQEINPPDAERIAAYEKMLPNALAASGRQSRIGRPGMRWQNGTGRKKSFRKRRSC